MGLIEICNRLEEFIVDMHDARDLANIKQQMEIKDITLEDGKVKKVVALRKDGGAYASMSAYFKIKADVAVDAAGNVYIPARSKEGKNGAYSYVRKIKRENVLLMVQEMISILDENNEGREVIAAEHPSLIVSR